MEKRRADTDSMVADVLADAKALRIKADETLAGKHDPVEYDTGFAKRVDGKIVKEKALFAEASEYKQQDIRTRLAWNMTMRAKAGEEFAQMMSALADKVHGTDLLVVAKPVPAERIQSGDKRLNSKGLVMTAVRQDGQRLYFSYVQESSGKTFKSWMSPRSWRTLQSA
jgi:hypothetical protein